MQELKQVKSFTESLTEPREGNEDYDPGQERVEERKQQRHATEQLEKDEVQSGAVSRSQLSAQHSRQSRRSQEGQKRSSRRQDQNHRLGGEPGAQLESDQPDGQKPEGKPTRQSSEDTLAPEDTAPPAPTDQDVSIPVYEEEYARTKRHHQSSSPEDSDPEPSQALQESQSRMNRHNTSESMRERKRKRSRFGLEPNVRLKQHHDGAQKLLWSRIRATLQEPFSEFLGVLVFTMIQQGGVAQATLSAGLATAPGGNGFGTYLTVPFT